MKPLFIGGTGRSGTSILKRVVAKHATIASFRTEMRLIVDPGGLLDLFHALTDRWSPYDADIAIHRAIGLLSDVESSNRLQKLKTRLMSRLNWSPRPYSKYAIGDQVGRADYRAACAALMESLIDARTTSRWAGSPAGQCPSRIFDAGPREPEELAPIIADFVTGLFRSAAGERACTHFIEDTPYNLLHLPDLLRIFPDMKMIHVYRDFRDVAASYLKQFWGRGDAETAAHRIRSIMAYWKRMKATIDPACFMEVGLENAVSDPLAFHERLTAFCELPEDETLRRGLAQLDPDRLHKGRSLREIDAEDLARIEEILAEPLADYGYL